MFPLCRLFKENVQSVTHVVSSCPVPARNQYRKRHDKTGKKYVGSCARNLKLNVKINGSRINQSQCWRMRNVKCFRTLQSRQIKKLEQRRPGIAVVDKEKRECTVINTAAPGDQNIKVKGLEKIKCQGIFLATTSLKLPCSHDVSG